MGGLNLQDQKMTDHKITIAGKCRIWKMTDDSNVSIQSTGAKMATGNTTVAPHGLLYG